VRTDKCPHFLITYGYILCKDIIKGLKSKESYIKSSKNNKIIAQKIENFPPIILKTINENYNRESFVSLLYELANGDLWAFFEKNKDNTKLLFNALIQIFLSITFFIHYTNKFHTDTHPGNFLFHKIKSGGYIKYELFGKTYYLENLGFLWVIWDFDLAVDFSLTMDKQYYNHWKNRLGSTKDFIEIFKWFIPKDTVDNKLIGYNYYTKDFNKNTELYELLKKIHKELIIKYDKKEKNIDFQVLYKYI